LGECFTTRFFFPLDNGITVTVACDVDGLSISTASTAIRLNFRFLHIKNTHSIIASVLNTGSTDNLKCETVLLLM
jgi:hypothetical protein